MQSGILGILWDVVEWLIDIGIKFLGNILMGFCSIMLRLVNAASKENLYDSICHAFNSVFWFSGNILIPFGIFILTIVLIWNLAKIVMSGQKGTKDDPISLVRRTIVAGVVIWATPVLIAFALGPSINKDVDGGNKVTSKISNGLSVMPVLLDGLSSFDGKGGIKLSDKSLKALNDFEKTNGTIMVNGMASIGMKKSNLPSPSEFNFSKEDNEDIDTQEGKGGVDSTTVYDTKNWTKDSLKAAADAYGIKYKKKVTKKELVKKLNAYKQEKSKSSGTVLDQLGEQMYAQYDNGGWKSGILWRLIYVIIFLIQPAMIIWNLVQLVWVFVKRAVSLILTACLAPVAIAFYPSQSTTEVTSRWIKMVFGYGITTVLTFAFLKLGAFVYAAAITVQYTEQKLILTITLNFACLAILGFVKEMESYVNNMGGNLVGFKNSISGQLGKIASKWGERALLAPLGVASSLTRTLPRAVGFATGRQGFFKNIGSRNLNKNKNKPKSDNTSQRNGRGASIKEGFGRFKNNMLHKGRGDGVNAQASAVIPEMNAYSKVGGGHIPIAEVKQAIGKAEIANVGAKDALAKNKNGNYFNVVGHKHGIEQGYLDRGNLKYNSSRGVYEFTPNSEDAAMFSNFANQDGTVDLRASSTRPETKVVGKGSGDMMDITHPSGEHSLIDRQSNYERIIQEHNIPEMSKDMVALDNNGCVMVSDGKNVYDTSKTIDMGSYNNLPQEDKENFTVVYNPQKEAPMAVRVHKTPLKGSKLSDI